MNNFVTESPYDPIHINDCIWYHNFEFLREYTDTVPIYDLEMYLDHFLLPEKMQGKTFLDVGTANGFFSFLMEKLGAEVVSLDLGLDGQHDQIPYPASVDRREDNIEFVKKLHKGYWYAHSYFRSRARAVYSSVMQIPDWLEKSDVTFVGSILQHLRDPLGALIEIDLHTRDTLILCEAYYESEEPVMRFQSIPDAPNPQYWTWWIFSPSFLTLALKTLGYKNIEVSGPFNLHNLPEDYLVPTITVKGTK